jgi:ABC-type uncharacterized transport system auxiliary subunit
MTSDRNMVRLLVLFFFITMIICGCASKPYLDLTYQLPAPSASQKGNLVCLTVKDTRQNKTLFSNAAKKEFQNFNGLFNLSIVDIHKNQSQLGTYKIEELFQKTLAKRMQNMGIKVQKRCMDQTPVMQVDIKTFKIDLVDHRWKASVGYDAIFTRDGKKKVKETITGNAERIKVVGSKAAQTVVEELFTDMINRLDINRLYDQSIL